MRKDGCDCALGRFREKRALGTVAWGLLRGRDVMFEPCWIPLVLWSSAFVSLFLFFVLCLVAQSCPALCNPMDCSPPGSSVHGDSQARILEGVAMPSSRGSSQPRGRTRVSRIAGILFTV